MLTTLQAGTEEMRVSFFQARLGDGEFVVIPLFSGRGDAGEGWGSEERAPIQNALLPETAFRTLADAFEENEG